MAGHGSLERILYIDEEIRSDRFPSVEQLKRKFEVNEKTIRRDIELMRDRLDAPIVYDRTYKGYRYNQPGFMLPAIYATEAEALEIAFVRYLTGGWRGTPLTTILANIWNKLSRILPNTISLDPAFFDQQVLIIDRSIEVDPDIWYTMLKAVRSHNVVSITHTVAKKQRTSRRTIHPYRMIHHLGAWYVIAFEPAIRDIRVFAVARIQDVRLHRGETFTVPADFNPDDYIDAQLGVFRGGDWIHVVIEAKPEVSAIVSERFPGRNHVKTIQESGSLKVEFDVREQEELIHWILQWSDGIKVLGPQLLRENIKKRLDSMIGLYDNPG